MEYHFYIQDDIEVEPYFSTRNSLNHYAWCLKKIMNELNQTSVNAEKREAVMHFQNNLKECSGTKAISSEFDLIISGFMAEKPLPTDDDIINFLTGIPVGEKGYYFSLDKA
jgi:hypothetical protein